MSIYDYVAGLFNAAHTVVHAGMDHAYNVEMSSISALYDNGPSTHCVTGPPITDDTRAEEAYYDAMARDAAGRAGAQE